MTIKELLELIGVNVTHYWWIVVLILSLVEVSKVKIAPISWIIEKLGSAFNRHLSKKLDNIEKDLKDVKIKQSELEDKEEERDAILSRVRILRFGDELQMGIEHSKEYFDEILRDIDEYEDYCRTHPKFKNNKTVLTIAHIKHVYEDCKIHNKFL